LLKVALNPLTLKPLTPSCRGVFDTTLCHKVCPWFVADRWFSLGTLVSSTKKNDRLDITEISLKVALDTIVPNPILTMYMSVLWHTLTRKWVSFMKWKTKDISHSQNNSKIQQEIIEDRGFDFDKGVLCTCWRHRCVGILLPSFNAKHDNSVHTFSNTIG
jgi:hypothetical protein